MSVSDVLFGMCIGLAFGKLLCFSSEYWRGWFAALDFERKSPKENRDE